MTSSWSRRHAGIVSSLGGLGGAIVAAAAVALVLGWAAVRGRSLDTLGGIAAIAAIAGAVVVGALLFSLARSGKLSSAEPAGGVGEQDATPEAAHD